MPYCTFAAFGVFEAFVVPNDCGRDDRRAGEDSAFARTAAGGARGNHEGHEGLKDHEVEGKNYVFLPPLPSRIFAAFVVFEAFVVSGDWGQDSRRAAAGGAHAGRSRRSILSRRMRPCGDCESAN